ncbi:MAG: carboxypeptidase-like regulatory domain-containing protein [Acidobacteriota bacterium]
MAQERPISNAPAGCVPNLCTSGELGGTWCILIMTSDGVKDSGETNPAAGVTVMAFDVNGTTYSATSDSAGRYEFSAANGNAIPAGSYPVRLESGRIYHLASGFQTTTPHGANNSYQRTICR